MLNFSTGSTHSRTIMMNKKSILKSAGFKIISIGLVLGLVFVLFSGYLAHQFMGTTKAQRLLHLKQATQMARNSIEPILAKYRAREISGKIALEQVRDLVRRMVYNDHIGENYIFMSSYDGIMLVQPFEPEKEMTDVWNLKDANGVYIIQALINAARSEKGEGYVSYHYQRPGQTAAQEKISFVIGIPELACYIGTGQYMADLRKSQIIYILKITGLTSVLLILLACLVWASTKEIRIQNARLQKTEQELTAIFNNTFQFIGTLSPDGILLKVNRSALAFIEMDEASVIGKPFWDTPWWQKDAVKSRLKKAVHDCANGEFCRFDVTHSRPNQEKFFIDFSLTPIFDEKGAVLFLLAEGRDMTDLTKAANDLIREKEFSDNLINSLPGLFYLYRREGKQFVLTKWNLNHERLLGFSPVELQNAPITTFIQKTSLPDLKAATTKVIEQGYINIELDVRKKNETSIPFLFMARSFEQSGDLFIVGTGIDLSEQKKAQADKKALEKMLNQSQKMEAVGTLAGGIAHDFNNILTAILGYAELVKDRISSTTTAAEMQNQIINSAIRAKELVQQILLFSRQAEQEMKPVRPELIITESLALLRPLIPTTIEIRQNISEGLGAILADATQIQQIIMNLCTNAYHAMRETGGVIEVSLSEKKILPDNSLYPELSPDPGSYFFLEVSDTGHGMDQATLEKIFDPYFTTKEKGEGTGLGLSVVHGIVKNCGGDIKIYSKPGQGTRIHIYFPKIEAADTPDMTDPQKTVLQTGRERILLVDDDDAVLDVLKNSLESLGYQVTAVPGSREALEEFSRAKDRFDLVITDMTMPHMTGVDLSRQIFEINPDIPIVLCTGYSELITTEKAAAIGIKAFLMKPVLRKVLSQTIREVLDRQRSL